MPHLGHPVWLLAAVRTAVVRALAPFLQGRGLQTGLALLLLSATLLPAWADPGPAAGAADAAPTGLQHGAWPVGARVPLFADRVRLRAAIGTDSAVLATLDRGDEVEILARDETTSTLDGYTQAWYRVRVAAPGGAPSWRRGRIRPVRGLATAGAGPATGPREGWLWGGLLPIAWCENAGGWLLVGIPGQPTEGHLLGEARLVQAGRLVASVAVPVINTPLGGPDRFGYTVAIERREIPALPRFSDIYEVSYIYEACGFTNGEALVFWDGKRLSAGPVARHVSEAGLFHVRSTFLFPGEAGCPPDELRISTLSHNDEENTTTCATASWRFVAGAWQDITPGERRGDD